MATVQEPRSRPTYDDILDARLNRARQQVRAADLTVAALGLVALTFGFGLVMLLLDRWLELPTIVRQFALGGFLVAATVYVLKVLRRPFSETINPYYAARQVERTLPESKNSLVSWLDLRDEPLPVTVREAVSRRAASDLDRADMDEAVRDTRLSRYGSLAGLLAVALIVLLCVFRPTQFMSLLARTFAPFTSTAIAHRTRIELLEPKGGDITVPINYSVDVRVDVEGRVPRADEPDALRLKFRYSEDDLAWEEKRLEPTDRSGEWSVRVPAAQVRNGFEYQVTGGDTATPMYRVRVRARSLFTEFEVRYHYRPYLRFADDTRADPNLQAVRGTEVTLLAKANRPVREGTLLFRPAVPDSKEQLIAGHAMPDRPDTLQYSLTLQQDGQYRLRFIAADGEPSDESLPYDVRVLPDNPPAVDITHPAPDKLPVNGTLTFTGKVTDDYGLTKARLTMTRKDNADGPAEVLPPVAFNAGKPLPSIEGREPRAISIKEVVPLDQLKDVAGGKIDLRPGMVITYRYEAEDNCDFPKPQLGQSKEYTVTLVEPQTQAERDAKREEADQEKKEHDEKQQEEANGGQKPGVDDRPKEGEPPNDQPMKPEDQQTIDQAKRIADELNKNSKPNPGGAKGDQNQQNKDSGKPDGNQKPQPDNSAKPKDGAGDKNQTKPNESKDKGNDAKTGDAKPEQNKAGQPNKPDNQAGDKNQGGDQQNKGNEQKPEQMNPPGQQRDENNKPSGDKNEPNKDKSQPGAKTSDTPENKKPDEKTEKSGEKPGTGAKEDKPNDTQPKTSPDKGNANKGQPGSQRAGEGQKEGDKNEKPKDAAMSGKSDPKAGKPEGDKPQGANDQGDKKPNPGEATKPEAGGATKPMGKDDKAKGQSTEDAQKPHTQPGEKPTIEPKTKGADGKPQTGDEKAKDKSDKPGAEAKGQSGEQKPKDGETKPPSGEGAPKPPDIQKLINDFKNADERNREMIMKQLERQVQEAKSSERKQAAEEAVKECKECNSPTNVPGSKSKPSTNKGGEGKANQPGQGKEGEGPKKEGDKPTPEGDMKPKTSEDEPKTGDAANDKTKPDPKGKPDDKGQAKVGEQPKDKPQDQPQGDGPGTAAGKRDGPADMPPDTTGKAPPPNEKFLREAGDLQLEQFKKKVDSKVLEQLKMTDEEYQAFLRSYENLVKRSKDAPKPGADDRARGGATGGSSANAGAKKVENGPKTGPQTNRGGRGPAPPEFRDQYKEFTEEQSKQAKPKDK
jgi:collagen type III alpha